MTEAAAAERFRHAHLVEAGLCGCCTDFAYECDQLVGKSAVVPIQTARILEQRPIALVSRNDFLIGEGDQAIACGDNVIRQIEGDSAQDLFPFLVGVPGIR